MSASKIACIILASGSSERFGAVDKLSADLCGKPMLSYVLETARSVGFGEMFFVSRMGLMDGVTSIKNNHPEHGQGHALRLGVGAAQAAGWESCVILLGDMPLVNSTYIQKLIYKYQEKQSVVSINKSIRMPPAIFNSAAMRLILSQTSVSGARDIFESLNPATMELDADAAQDVDTPEDLARVAQMMKARTT